MDRMNGRNDYMVSKGNATAIRQVAREVGEGESNLQTLLLGVLVPANESVFPSHLLDDRLRRRPEVLDLSKHERRSAQIDRSTETKPRAGE
jgi:hypothetical protein